MGSEGIPFSDVDDRFYGTGFTAPGHPGTPGDMATQWDWHHAFRDGTQNMYRTTYQDMIHAREVYVQSSFPSGYGGHNPRIRHDVLFRNGQFDKNQTLAQTDVSRDSMPSFQANIDGVPGFCFNPCGAKKVPGYKSVQRDGLLCPWAITKVLQPPPGYRRPPPMTSALKRSTQERLRQTGQQSLRHVASEPSLAPPSPAPASPVAAKPPTPAAAPVMQASASMPELPPAKSTAPVYQKSAPKKAPGEDLLKRSLSQSSYNSSYALMAGDPKLRATTGSFK